MSKNTLEKVYSEGTIDFQKKRYAELSDGFEKIFRN